MNGFDEFTGSVAAPYLSRFHKGYVAWRGTAEKRIMIEAPGKGLEEIGGNGFGCSMIRAGLLRSTVFRCSGKVPDFDIAFYGSLQNRPSPNRGKIKVKIDWSQECKHLESV